MTERNDKPIPKSLHTVRVLTEMAKLFRDSHRHNDEQALTAALVLLGYDSETPDTHGIRAAVLKAMQS